MSCFRCSEPDAPLYVILPYFNFCGYKRRRKLFIEFLDQIRDLKGIRIVVTEALGPAALPRLDVFEHWAFETDSPVWLKENLINMAIRRLPKGWKYVAWIDAAIDTEQGTAVRLAVPAPPEGVRGGLAVQVRIELERRQNTVVIPDTALRDADSRPWVLVVVDGVAERREVRPGLQGDDGIEIIEGVDAGEMLVSTSSPNIRPGDKVRAQ